MGAATPCRKGALLACDRDVHGRRLLHQIRGDPHGADDDGRSAQHVHVRLLAPLLLLGFENMLRSYGGEFSCITVPYWNYVDDNQRYLLGGCRSMEECSLLLRDFGGSLNGFSRSVTINGSPIGGTCVITFAKPRTSVEETARVVSLVGLVELPIPTDDDCELACTPALRDSNHCWCCGQPGTRHSQHRSQRSRRSYGRPRSTGRPDFLFPSCHHRPAALHLLKCVVGNTVPIPLEQKLSDPRVYTECPRRRPLPVNAIDRNILYPQSNVLLRTGEEGTNPTSVFSQFNMLDPFFADLPSSYLSFSDIRDLGVFSYNYEMTGLLAEMFTTCPGAGFGPACHSVSLKAPTTPRKKSITVIVPSNKTADNWFSEALAAASNSSSVESVMEDASQGALDAIEDVEKMTCVFYDECRGGVHDFSTISARASMRMARHRAPPSSPTSKAVATRSERPTGAQSFSVT
ncbi:hypothetical protein GQ600_816 [Phytophthora cactorum]|nr:hypothetical protein GQ600_816 [Phytophthora cactorum]